MPLRYRWLSALAALAVLFAASMFSGDASARTADAAYDREELKLLEIMNKYRQDNGLPALMLSDALTLASERHSWDMGRYDFYGHNTVKSYYFPAGSSPWDRMARSGYDYPNASGAENLAVAYDSAEGAFRAWRESPGHNRNILDGNQRVIGIARVRVPDSAYGWYWTTDFGSEKDPTSHPPGETRPSSTGEKEKQGAQKGQTAQKGRATDKADKGRVRASADRGGIENGSMEGSAVWKKTAKEGENLIEQGVARLGGYDNAKDEISQKIKVQKSQKLLYRVRVETQEEEEEETEDPADNLVVRLTDEAGKHLVTLDSHAHTDAAARETGGDGWIRDGVDLSRFVDKTVRISFLAKTNEERPTTFYLDEVALE